MRQERQFKKDHTADSILVLRLIDRSVMRLLAKTGLLISIALASMPIAAAPDKKSNWETEPFSTAIEVVPKNFSGHNPHAILTFLKKSFPTKSEFESDADFAVRTDQLKEKVIYGKIRAKDTLAFVFSPTEMTYDANTRMFTVTVEQRNFRAGQRLLDDYSGFTFERNRTNSGSYIVENGFGAKRTAVKYTENNKGLHFVGQRNSWTLQTLTTQFEIAADEARKLKSLYGVSIIAIGRLASPMAVIGNSHWLPDMNHLQDVREHSEIIIFEPEAIWTIQDSSGKVLSKNHEFK